MSPPSTRENIIDAAMAVVREQGVGKLTLDAAAKMAGLSKGGVLYHFKSKDDLISGMVQRMIESCESLSLEYYEAEADGPYRYARALVRTTFDPRGPASDPIGGALLAAVGVNPELLAPFHEKFQEWMEQVESDSPDPALSGLICLALDGYVFDRMLNLPMHDSAMLARIQQNALDLLK